VKERISGLASWLIICDQVLEETKELLSYLPQPGDEGNDNTTLRPVLNSFVSYVFAYFHAEKVIIRCSFDNFHSSAKE
jgi:hypothetical protein